MKVILKILFLVFIVSSCENNEQKKANSNKSDDSVPVEITQKEKVAHAKKVLALISASKEHEVFKSLEGNWSYKSTVRSPDGTRIFVGEGTTKNEIILDGRFLLSKSKSIDNRPMAIGLMVLGFNRQTSNYEITLYSDGGTYGVNSNGILKKTKETNYIQTNGSRNDPILKVDEKFEINIEWLSDSSYLAQLKFKDPYSKSTFEEIIIEYTKSDE